MGTQSDVSLAAALQEHAARTARADAIRFQFAMALLGFVGGLVLVVPLVLWILPKHASIFPGATAAQPPVAAQIVATEPIAVPSLVSRPTIAVRDDAQSASDGEIGAATGHVGSGNENPVEIARGLIRSGDILGARRILGRPELGQSGQALFMLAETYDPNVLAALGAMDVHAETSMARRYYEAALSEGVAAASPRLEALQ
jgi:hypothetical protein